MFALLCFLLPLFAAQAAPANPQPANVTTPQSTASAAAEPMPTDPAALLALAAKKNGLQNIGSTPWHLKAIYELLDDRGKSTQTGTFEYFWVSGKKYKVVYESPSFNQTEIGTENGSYLSGDSGYPKAAAAFVRRTLFYKMLSPDQLSNADVSLRDQTISGVRLKCIEVKLKSNEHGPPIAVDYLASDLPLLRLSVGQGNFFTTLFNDIVAFQGIYISRRMEVRVASQLALRIHIETLEPWVPEGVGTFTPLPGALYVPAHVFATGSLTAGRITTKIDPVYPIQAKENHIQGVVILHAVINREGKISDLQPIIGPRELVAASMQAVRGWKYKPYLLDGVPTDVETEINVVFRLGSP
jgi:TonB family protein